MVSGLAFEGHIYFVKAKNGTNENRIITSDTIWTKANCPYTLTGPVGVSTGVTLAIEPGTTVYLATIT
jgi:hypothetical protein